MIKLPPWLLAGIVLTTVPANGRADPIYTLSLSTSADANHLQLGQSVTFDVSLSGITSDSTTDLSYLEALVSDNKSLLSFSPVVTPGGIVPNTNLSGFLGTPLPDGVDASYEGFYFVSPPAPLSSSGNFFSFQATATQVGSGTLSFSYAVYTLADDSNQNLQSVPDTNHLDFTIVAGSGVATPEPSTLVLFISSMFGLSVGTCLRRLARRLRLGQSAVTASAG